MGYSPVLMKGKRGGKSGDLTPDPIQSGDLTPDPIHYVEPPTTEPSAILIAQDYGIHVENFDDKGCLYNLAIVHNQSHKDDGIEHAYRLKAGVRQVVSFGKRYDTGYRDVICGRLFTFIPKQGAKYRFSSELLNPQGSIFANAMKSSRGWKCKTILMEESQEGVISRVIEEPAPVCATNKPSRFDWIKKLHDR
jgi:hypothetical protein